MVNFVPKNVNQCRETCSDQSARCGLERRRPREPNAVSHYSHLASLRKVSHGSSLRRSQIRPLSESWTHDSCLWNRGSLGPTLYELHKQRCLCNCHKGALSSFKRSVKTETRDRKITGWWSREFGAYGDKVTDSISHQDASVQSRQAQRVSRSRNTTLRRWNWFQLLITYFKRLPKSIYGTVIMVSLSNRTWHAAPRW